MSEAKEMARKLRDEQFAADDCGVVVGSQTADDAANLIDKQAAEIKALRAALAPFSAMAGPFFMANYNDQDVVLDPNLSYDGEVKPILVFRDFRIARNVSGA